MVTVSKYARAIKSLWRDKCTVSIREYVTNEKNGVSEPREIITLKDEACRIIYKTIEPTGEGNAATRRQETILLIDKSADIPEGSKLSVTHEGVTEIYARSGTAAIYSVHKEIPLELFWGWA